MLTAVPEMTWLARRWIESTAWTRPRKPPAAIAPSSPICHEPVSWDTTTPQKQPISIMPSRPMLTTPERSEKRPPSAPKVSGVAYWNAPTKSPVETIAATSGLCVRHTITSSTKRTNAPRPICARRVTADVGPGLRRQLRWRSVRIDVRHRRARAWPAPTSQRTTSSPPTSRMIVPWMMLETPLASSGLNDPESCVPPLCSAANRSAASTTPMAVLRPSSATAMPVKPMSRTGTSEEAIE